MTDITRMRADRDARLASIEPRHLHGMTEAEIRDWRDLHASVEVTWQPKLGLGPMIDHVLAILERAAVTCRPVSLYHWGDTGPKATVGWLQDIVLDAKGFTFGGLTIPLHDMHWDDQHPDTVPLVGRGFGLLVHSDEGRGDLHQSLRDALDAWRATADEMIISIDGVQQRLPSEAVVAYGLSLTTGQKPIDLQGIGHFVLTEGDRMSSPTVMLQAMTDDGHVISIAPVSTIHPTDAEGLARLGNAINADFGSIYVDMPGIGDVGRSAIQLPGVDRIVVVARDLAPMERAYAALDAEKQAQNELDDAAYELAQAMPTATEEQRSARDAAMQALEDKVTSPFSRPEYEEGGLIEILAWEPGRAIDALDATRAAWSAYVLSLKASQDLGLNDRCHVSPPHLADVARKHADSIGAVTTPHDCVYGSDACFWELSELSYDPASRTLTIQPQMGS